MSDSQTDSGPQMPILTSEEPKGVELVVEIRSLAWNWIQVYARVVERLRAGARAVIVLDPTTRTASVYRDDVVPCSFREDEELIVPDILPGLAVAVRRLFE